MIFVQFNENVENETTGHELWPGFCSNQFKSSKCDLASKIILFIQKMSKPKIGDLGNGVFCSHDTNCTFVFSQKSQSHNDN